MGLSVENQPPPETLSSWEENLVMLIRSLTNWKVRERKSRAIRHHHRLLRLLLSLSQYRMYRWISKFICFSVCGDSLLSKLIHFSVHLRLEDKIVVRIGRDGGLQSFELSGLLTLRVSDEKYGRIKIQLENTDQRGIQLQTHPNVDKELFKSKCQIGLKNPAKPFPLNTDVGVLKWRYQTQDESAIPLTSEWTHSVHSFVFFTSILYFQLIVGHRKTLRVVAMWILNTS